LKQVFSYPIHSASEPLCGRYGLGHPRFVECAGHAFLLRERVDRGSGISRPAIDVGIHFEEDRSILSAGEQKRLVGDPDWGSDRDAREEIGDVVRMETDTTVRSEAVDAGGRVGAVNSASGPREADEIVAEGISRPGRDLGPNGLAQPAHLLLYRDGHVPRRPPLLLLHAEAADRGLPVGTAHGDGVPGYESSLMEQEEESLRHVDEDPFIDGRRHNVTIID
jgi:hypothetical protein